MLDEAGLRALLASDRVTPATRAALQARLDARPAAPRFLDAESFATLQAACAQLIPQPERAEAIDLAAEIDQRLSQGESDGWRYDELPPDGEAMRSGLRGLNEQSAQAYGLSFARLAVAQQEAVLQEVQRGRVRGGAWDTLPPKRFFEELLAACVESYYSHPLVQAEIGFLGFADAHGWQAAGLTERE